MGIEAELSYLCGMIQSGKISYEDAVNYLKFMRDEYGIEEEQFQEIYAIWVRNGELCREWNPFRRAEKKEKFSGLYRYVLEGMYEMVEQGELNLSMVTENLWKDAYEVREEPGRGFAGFYPELPGCIGYGENLDALHKNMKKVLKNWVCAAYDQWRETQIISGKADGIFDDENSYT